LSTLTASQAAPTGAAPAGLNLAQMAAWQRLQQARTALADLEPLEDDYLAAEHAWEAWRRWSGEDS
jgi:hypothetical protein